MTLQERIIVSAYTGKLMCDFRFVHKYIEKILGRKFYTHEMCIESVEKEIKEKTKNDFLSLCGDQDPKCEKRLEWEAAAIQKQIPREPLNIEMFNGKISRAKCPACSSDFPDIGGTFEIYDEVEQFDYCPDCGQRIDWRLRSAID